MLGLDEIHHPSLAGIIEPAIIGAIGLIAGGFVYSNWEEMRATSIWQWLLPLALLLIAMGDDARLFGFRSIWGEYFVGGRQPGMDEPSMGNILLTYPTVSALCYSVGAALMSRRSKAARAGYAETTSS
jgi:hypothetical protein